MSQFQTISTTSLCLASVLVIISILISYRQELKLEKDIFISALRALYSSLLSALFYRIFLARKALYL